MRLNWNHWNENSSKNHPRQNAHRWGYEKWKIYYAHNERSVTLSRNKVRDWVASVTQRKKKQTFKQNIAWWTRRVFLKHLRIQFREIWLLQLFPVLWIFFKYLAKKFPNSIKLSALRIKSAYIILELLLSPLKIGFAFWIPQSLKEYLLQLISSWNKIPKGLETFWPCDK